jgi:HAD superfamily hydrolase (TIGR01509 family)
MLEIGFKAKCVFLDLDGTIVDSTEAYLEAAKVSFKAIGHASPANETALEIPRRLEQGLSISDLTYGDPKRFLSTYLKTYYLVTRQKTKLIPNVKATLGALAENSKLALITMRYVPKQSIIEELEFFGIAGYFTHVVTALDTAKPKPSPEALFSCAKALSIKVNECVIAGDSVNDVRAGKAAGARTVAVLSGLFQSEELAKEDPDLILNDVTSLPDFIG